MKRLHIARHFSALGILLFGIAAQAATYSITVMDAPGATASQGFDINNAGVFVGSASTGVDGFGYLISGGVTTTLTGPSGALGASALGISDGGVVVGSFYTTHVPDPGGGPDGQGPQTGYIFAGGSYTALAYPGATDTLLRGISPDGRYVTGYALVPGGTSAFVYDRMTSSFTTVVDSSLLAIAQGVTTAGLVVGSHITTGPVMRYAFTYDTGTALLTDFQIAGALDTRYRGISEAGVIDGWFRDAAGVHGFIGSAALYDAFDVPGALNTYLEGINDAGWLAGIYDDAAGVSHAFLARAVPEPAILLLLLAAIAGLAATRRRA
ncbi:MAG: PEP-CTERM sorting domain-containing protein [Burkholderiales bacterium]|nr:PEP-CTERM sorting domain-containing protein [Burkholderiales bacterium]